MAIEVRIPTILRSYTGGAKMVESVGATLSDVVSDLDRRHPGIGERLVDGNDLRRFINVYVNDEDVRFTGGLATEVTDGDTVVVLPAVAGGAPADVPHVLTSPIPTASRSFVTLRSSTKIDIDSGVPNDLGQGPRA